MTSFFIIRLLFTLFVVSNTRGEQGFYVEKSGHSKVKPGEISVTFYMTVANAGKSSVKVLSKNINCCWAHDGTSSKYDCESMDVLGGIPITLEPSKTANVTYIFTNMYPLDRVGQCVFHLWHGSHKIAHTIRFNTTYSVEEPWLKAMYKKITGDFGKDRKTCETVDLDKRRQCKPVNCVQKYNGKRNFFRKETKLCEPVHECHTKVDEDNLPTTAFDKDHNRCKSLLQKQLTKEEEDKLRKDAEELENAQEKNYKYVDGLDPIPINCNHGKPVGSMCVCDDGWKTDTSKVPLGDPQFIYNWCNVRTRKKTLLSFRQQKQFMIAGLSLTIITLLVAWLWLLYRYFYLPTVSKQAPKPSPPTRAPSTLPATNELIKTLSSENMVRRKSTTPPKGLSFEPAEHHENPIVMPPRNNKVIAASNASTASLAGQNSDNATVSFLSEGVTSNVSTASLAGQNSDNATVSFSPEGASNASTASLAGQKSDNATVLFSPEGVTSNAPTASLAGQRSDNATVSFLSGGVTSNAPTASLAGQRSDNAYLLSPEGVTKPSEKLTNSSFASQASAFSLYGAYGDTSQPRSPRKDAPSNIKDALYSINSISQALVKSDSADYEGPPSGSTSTMMQSVPEDRPLFTRADQASTISLAASTRKPVLSSQLSGLRRDHATDTTGLRRTSAAGGGTLSSQMSAMHQPGVYNVTELISGSQMGRETAHDDAIDRNTMENE